MYLLVLNYQNIIIRIKYEIYIEVRVLTLLSWFTWTVFSTPIAVYDADAIFKHVYISYFNVNFCLIIVQLNFNTQKDVFNHGPTQQSAMIKHVLLGIEVHIEV